jgi:general secretion pathway protein N
VRRAGFFIVTGVGAYFLILVFTWPAVQVEGYIEKQLPGLSLSAVSGSVFQGQAGRVGYQGTDLGSARWQLLPLALLIGRVEYHIEFSAPAGPGQANAGVTFAGNIYGYDIDLNFSPDRIIYRYSPVAVNSSGVINLLVEAFKLSDGFPREFTGKAVWKSAAILAPVEMVFGDTVLDLKNAGEELVGSIENEGDFKVSGKIAFDPEGNYRVDLLLVPEADADRQTVLLLENTTTVQPGGKYRLRSSGQW